MSAFHTPSTRRSFLKRAGALGAALPFVTGPLIKAAASDRKLRHVSFGSSGMAHSDLMNFLQHPRLDLVAICDVDRRNFETDSFKKDFLDRFPNLKLYTDWRELLDKEADHFDSCNVTVPDHMHAPIGVSAIRLGKHVYGQKPLGQNLHDTRMLTTEARKHGVVTQMGIQIHSSNFYRWAAHIVQGGHLGKVKEIHTWSSKKWGDKGARPTHGDPIPKGFDWDGWLGVASARPYKNDYYHPGNWRKRLDFGTGTFGDMGCHIYDPVFNAVGSPTPLRVTSHGPAPDGENWAINAQVEYVFKGNQFIEGDTLSITWYDGDRRPPKEVVALLEGRKFGGAELPSQGSIFIGTEGAMLLVHFGSPPMMFPRDKFLAKRAELYPELEPWNHWRQFVDCCLDGGKPDANFDYAGPLTEAVLLGCASTFFPSRTLDWDTANLRFTNSDDANKLVRRHYRKGWEVEGMG